MYTYKGELLQTRYYFWPKLGEALVGRGVELLKRICSKNFAAVLYTVWSYGPAPE
jgi:hypothetical protein